MTDLKIYLYSWSGSIVNSAMSVMNTQISANKKARHKIWHEGLCILYADQVYVCIRVCLYVYELNNLN